MELKQAIVFDLGGVMIDWNPRHLYRKMFRGDEPAMEKFLSEVCTSEWNAEQDRGRSFADATALLIDRHPDQEVFIRAWFERWPEMIAGTIEGMIEIFAELKKAERKIYALSNWSRETYPMARRSFAFFDWFDHIVISGEVGMVKPNRDIFDHLLGVAGRRVEECIFIDDSLTNVEAAIGFGFDAIHFRSSGELRDDLTNRGVLEGR